MAAKHITGELTAIVKALLGKATREQMLQWLGAVIEGNMERAKMQADMRVGGRRPQRLQHICHSCKAIWLLLAPLLPALLLLDGVEALRSLKTAHIAIPLATGLASGCLCWCSA